jgi:hypothetical protein
VAASLAKLGLPRMHIIENEYLLAIRRAELAWIGRLTEDIRSGDLTWTGTTEEHKP